MTNQELIDRIKIEARLATDDDFDTLIIGILNELYVEATIQERIPELRNTEIFDIEPLTEEYEIPNGYLKIHSVRFFPFDFESGWDLAATDGIIEPAPPGFYGYPKSYEITGEILKINPVSEVSHGDLMKMVYFEKPPLIESSTLNDENYLPRLEPFLIRETISRLHFHHEKIQLGTAMKQGAQTAGQAFSEENNATTIDQ